MDGFEVSRPATLQFIIRNVDSLEEAETLVNEISHNVGTFMIDTHDFRFRDYLSHQERDSIIEISAEEI